MEYYNSKPRSIFKIAKVQSPADFDSISKSRCTKDKICLKNVNFNFTKRENIDKTIMRKFRKFVYYGIKSNFLRNNIDPFWKEFTSQKYLPPFRTEHIEFKSFSTSYMIWVFSHPDGIELYDLFINAKLDEIIHDFSRKYEIIQISELRDYLTNANRIFQSEFYKTDLVNRPTNEDRPKEVLTITKHKNASTYNKCFSQAIPHQLLVNLIEYKDNHYKKSCQYVRYLDFLKAYETDTINLEKGINDDLN